MTSGLAATVGVAVAAAETSRVARGPLIAALLLRLMLPAAALLSSGGDWSRFLTPDTNTYMVPARHLLEHGAFTSLSGPEIFRTPGYPIVLMLGLIVGQPIVLTLLLQALAGTLTVWCTMCTASLMFEGANGVAPRIGNSSASTGRDDSIHVTSSAGSIDGAGASAALGSANGTPSATAANRRVVTMCGWLAACEPLALVCGALLTADTLLTTAISVAVLLLMMHFRQPSTRSAVALGVTLAIAAYIKPIAYYLPALLIPWLWLEQRRSNGGPAAAGTDIADRRALTNVWRGQANASPAPAPAPGPATNRPRRQARHARHLLTLAAAFVLLCGVWQVRNGMQTRFWGFSTLTARAVYVAAGGGVIAARDGRAFGDVRQERLRQAAIPTPREPLHIGDMYRRGLSDVLQSPGIAVTVHVRGMLLTLFDPGSLDYLRLFGAYPATSPVTRFGGQGVAAIVTTIAREYPAVLWYSLLLEAILLAYLALAARGAWRALRARIPETRGLLLIAAYFLILSGGIFGTARFRLPIMPVMILLAGYALTARPVGYTERA